MFALKKNKTDFHGRPLRIFPSSENPKQGNVLRIPKIVLGAMEEG